MRTKRIFNRGQIWPHCYKHRRTIGLSGGLIGSEDVQISVDVNVKADLDWKKQHHEKQEGYEGCQILKSPEFKGKLDMALKTPKQWKTVCLYDDYGGFID